MRDVVVLEETRDHQIDPSTLPDTLFDAPPSDSGIEVTVELSESAVSLLGDYDATVSDATGGVVRAQVTIAHLVNLRRLVTRAPGAIRVISPDFAVAEVAQWASAGAIWHSQEPPHRS
jgi:proteasome accessory factor C